MIESGETTVEFVELDGNRTKVVMTSRLICAEELLAMAQAGWAGQLDKLEACSPPGGVRARRRRVSGQARAGVGPALEERLDVVHLEGAGEEKALAAFAVLFFEQRELVLLLDALGEGLDRECLAELDERMDDGVALLV